MKLVTPDFGLVIWMSLTFLTVLFLLSKFAWKPILKMIKDREESIEGALQSAEKAKQEMVRLQSNNESLLREAQLEREAMLKAARDAKDAMINDAKATAKAEADRMISLAREAINNEKQAAVTELKNQVAQLSLQVAEKLIREQLSNDEKQKELANKLVAELKLN
jgi:F-type H+-transporting ATPase subunit b